MCTENVANDMEFARRCWISYGTSRLFSFYFLARNFNCDVEEPVGNRRLPKGESIILAVAKLLADVISVLTITSTGPPKSLCRNGKSFLKSQKLAKMP